MIGLDTTAIIDLFKKDTALIKFLEETDDKIALNQITYLEIMLGLNLKGGSHKSEEEYFDNLFNSCLVFPLNNLSCKKASKIFLELKNMGKIIEEFDCTIAGIYLSNNVRKILTRNKKHFENIKELQVLSY